MTSAVSARSLRLVLFVSLILLSREAERAAQNPDLAVYLPPRDELRALRPDGTPQVFKGEDLFVYIDGGADIYLEYGFLQVLVQDYHDSSGRRISLEIFEMTSAESAFGMFTFKTGSDGKALKMGDDCRLADYYLNLWKDRFILTITALDPGEAAAESLVDLAKSVDARIKGKGTRPELYEKIPREGLKKETVKYIKGPIALANAERLLAGSVTGFLRGIKAEYQPGYSVVLIEFPDADDAAAGLRSAVDFFSRKRLLKDFGTSDDWLQGEAESGRKFAAKHIEKYLLTCLGANSWEEAAGILEKFGRIRVSPG